jgi:hypothetical protein
VKPHPSSGGIFHWSKEEDVTLLLHNLTNPKFSGSQLTELQAPIRLIAATPMKLIWRRNIAFY